jgi:hypothetical protein
LFSFLAVIWLLAAAGMAEPSYLTTRLLPITEDKAAGRRGGRNQTAAGSRRGRSGDHY